jgi:hypothetical protein
MKVLQRLFSRNPAPKTEEEIALLIEGFANGTGGRWDWDYFISTQFQIERIKWAQEECFKVEEEFPRTGRTGWCNEQGLNRLRSIASELRAAAHSDSDQDGSLPVARSPQFSVDVQLSDAAKKKLVDDKETIIVLGVFTGHPKEGAEARFLDKVGQVLLGEVRREIRPGEIATFEQINLNPNALAQIDSQGPWVFIEVFSGRRSSKDNLLYSEDYEGGFESVLGRTMVLHCQLIAERFPRSGR